MNNKLAVYGANMPEIENVSKLNENSKNQQNEPGRKYARVITVASGKGGVGKTSLSVNMSIAYSRLGKKVLLMDADLGLANINILLGIIPKFTLFDVIKGTKNIEEIIIPYKENVFLIPGASGFYQLSELKDDQKKLLVDNLEKLDDYDIIIVDAGAGVSNNVLSFIAASSEVIIVTTPEPHAIADAYGIIKVMASRSIDIKMKLIVNMVQNIEQGKKVYQKIADVCLRFLGLKIDNLGYVFEDECVKKSISMQKPLVLTFPQSKAAHSIEHLVLRLEKLDYLITQQKGMKTFLKKLFTLYVEE